MKKSQAKYYHLDLEVSEKDGKWYVSLKDSLNQTTLKNMNDDSTCDAAKDRASTVAHWYLAKEYPKQEWSVIPISWKDLK